MPDPTNIYYRFPIPELPKASGPDGNYTIKDYKAVARWAQRCMDNSGGPETEEGSVSYEYPTVNPGENTANIAGQLALQSPDYEI